MANTDSVIQSVFDRYALENPETMEQLLQLGEIRELARGETLERAGTPTNAFYLIVEGVVRYFYTSESGKERNKAFFREAQFIGSLSAFYTDKIIRFDIQALESCTLLRFPFEKIDFEGDLKRLLAGVTKELFIRNERREAILLSGDASQRFLWVKDNEEWLINRVPQFHLASYLGLEPGSLSRVKARLS